jgi:hypothetical protein
VYVDCVHLMMGDLYHCRHALIDMRLHGTECKLEDDEGEGSWQRGGRGTWMGVVTGCLGMLGAVASPFFPILCKSQRHEVFKFRRSM